MTRSSAKTSSNGASSNVSNEPERVTTRICPVCERMTLRSRTLGYEQVVGSVAVHGEPLTVEWCSCGHVAVPRRLGEAAREATRRSLLVAHRRWRTQICGDCGAALTMPARRTTRVVTVTPDDHPIVTLTFDLVMQRCPGCGLDQLRPQGRHEVETALAGLLQAVAEHVTGRTPLTEQGPFQRLKSRLRRSNST